MPIGFSSHRRWWLPSMNSKHPNMTMPCIWCISFSHVHWIVTLIRTMKIHRKIHRKHHALHTLSPNAINYWRVEPKNQKNWLQAMCSWMTFVPPEWISLKFSGFHWNSQNAIEVLRTSQKFLGLPWKCLPSPWNFPDFFRTSPEFSWLRWHFRNISKVFIIRT